MLLAIVMRVNGVWVLSPQCSGLWTCNNHNALLQKKPLPPPDNSDLVWELCLPTPKAPWPGPSSWNAAGSEDICRWGFKGCTGDRALASRGSWPIPLPWIGPEAGHRKAPVDWLPAFQVPPSQGISVSQGNSCSRQHQWGTMERRLLLGGPVTEPVGHLCCCLQPRVDTAAAKDIFFSPGVGNSCCESCRAMWEGRQAEGT